MKKQLAALTALLLILTVFTACGSNNGTGNASDAIAAKKQDGSRAQMTELGEMKTAQSYSEVLEQFQTLSNQPSDLLPEEPAAPDDVTGNENPDYTGTNIQVAGVDEADVVKTDGEYLYILGHNALKIVRADGAKTEEISTTQLALPEDEINDSGESFSDVNAMYIRENTASIIWQQEQYSYGSEIYSYSNTTHMSTYDVSDASAPKLIKDVAQDGYYLDSRMTDGIIYLVTSKAFYYIDERTNEDNLIPCTFDDGTPKQLPVQKIYLCPNTDNTTFTVISAIDGKSGEIADSICCTDNTETVYMDTQKLYLARTCYTQGESEPYTENQYQVVDYTQRVMTQITRIGFADGTLTIEQSGSVEGALCNQFSIDAYNGNLRIATTTEESSYSVYTDEAYGWSNTLSLNDETVNRVTILDSALKELGRIDNLAPDEEIYGVRFIDAVGYVVTYETVDPIFTIDLSDPTKPVLCSELEVPGVSMYLHPYGNGLLLGFGQNADGNVTDGLLLSMFDVSNPAKVMLTAQSPLDANYSEALNNHKAILVNSEKNIIAFPVENDRMQFLVYAYENGAFVQKGTFTLDYFNYDMRGLFIGDYLYICGSDVVYAVQPDTCELVAERNSAEG